MTEPATTFTPDTADVRGAYHAWSDGQGDDYHEKPAWSFEEFDRWLVTAKAAAWDEGAKWAAVEFSGDDRYENGAAFLAPGDNPYREKPKPECICYGYGIDFRCGAHEAKIPFGVGNE